MDLSCCLWCFRSFFDRPCTDFRFSCCQVTDQSEKAVACLDQLFKARFLKSQFFQEHALFIIIKFRNLLLNFRTYNEYFTVLSFCILTDCLYSRITCTIICKIIFCHICSKNDRLVGQKIVAFQPLLFIFVIDIIKALCHLSIFQMCFNSFHQCQFFCDRLVISCCSDCFGNSSFQDFKV